MAALESREAKETVSLVFVEEMDHFTSGDKP